jgi:hypothetical protein
MKSFAICTLTAVPVRRAATHRGEMCSQLLFGELVELLSVKNHRWVKIRSLDDHNIGWVPLLQLQPISEEELYRLQPQRALVLDLFHSMMGEHQAIPLTLGANLPGFDGMQLYLGQQRYTFSGQAVFPEDIRQPLPVVLRAARQLINVPFLWGGRTPLGLDSTGFVQLCCRVGGIFLPRTAEQQLMYGETIDFMQEAQEGDLAFFENAQGKIAHAGILLGEGEIIHVFDKVCVDWIDHFGIYNRRLRRYTHRLRLIKRLLPPADTK